MQHGCKSADSVTPQFSVTVGERKCLTALAADTSPHWGIGSSEFFCWVCFPSVSEECVTFIFRNWTSLETPRINNTATQHNNLEDLNRQHQGCRKVSAHNQPHCLWKLFTLSLIFSCPSHSHMMTQLPLPQSMPDYRSGREGQIARETTQTVA